MKVRIKSVPKEREIDGVNLERFEPGTVSEVSSTIGSWLITEGYAELEMRPVRSDLTGQPISNWSPERRRNEYASRPPDEPPTLGFGRRELLGRPSERDHRNDRSSDHRDDRSSRSRPNQRSRSPRGHRGRSD